MAEFWTRVVKDGVTFKVHVQPRAAHSRIQGLHGGALKLSLTAAPVGGAANRGCCAFLAAAVKVPKSAVEIVGGFKSRQKTVLVHGLDKDTLLRRLGLD